MDMEYREYRIDLRGVRDRSGLHDRIEQALPLPQWYGRNLDALYDVLTEPVFGEGCTVYFTGCEDFEESMPGYFRALQQMCGAASEDNPGLSVYFLSGEELG